MFEKVNPCHPDKVADRSLLSSLMPGTRTSLRITVLRKTAATTVMPGTGSPIALMHRFPRLWAEPYDHGRWDPAVPVSPTYVQCTRGRRDGRRLVQPSCFPVSPRIKASGFLGLMASVGIGDPSASSSSFERAAARIMPGAGDSRPMCIGLLCMLRNFVRCSQERRQERCCIS